jgi:hypothetical protein
MKSIGIGKGSQSDLFDFLIELKINEKKIKKNEKK